MMPNPAVGMYLFDVAGTQPYAQTSGASLPIEADQVEGILGAVGGFRLDDPSGSAGKVVARVRYDGFDILGIRGERCVMAAVSSEPIEATDLQDLHRSLASLERRWTKGLLVSRGVSEAARESLFARLFRRTTSTARAQSAS
jgi:hypothetical protein